MNENIREVLKQGSLIASKFFDFNSKAISPYHVVN